jgi:Flp pilus assembly protein TadD
LPALEEGLALAEPIEDLQALELAHWLLGELEVLDGRAAEARVRLEPLQVEEGPYIAPLLATLAWAHLELGDMDRAGETARRAQEIAHERQQKLYLPEVLTVQGMILARQGRWQEAEQSFGEAVSLAQGMPYPYAEGRAHSEWGAMHLQQGDREQAREQLKQALEVFQRLGAQKDIERTEQALAELTAASSQRAQ